MKEDRNVLFLAPPGLDIYKDVITGMEAKGYCVDYVSSLDLHNNPFMPIFHNQYSEENVKKFEEACENYWREKLSSEPFKKKYDVFFSINGLMVCPFLFQYLKKLNPDIKCRLFLYDKIEFACRVDRYFCFYDKVFSFDLGDVSHYHLHFLPIYWVPANKEYPHKFDVFGMASYSLHKKDRAHLFRQIKKVSDDLGLKSFVKLYVNMENWPIFIIKNLIKMFKRHKTYIPFIDIFNGLVTNKALAPRHFRDYIYGSEVIIDTHVEYQDGLTARFMWALGAEKKIVTTNTSVKRYAFYTREQFFILGEDSMDRLKDFVSCNFCMSRENRNMITQYRIDNWLDCILN